MGLSLNPSTLQACFQRETFKKNRISELPDDILLHILSFLTMKEAGITSVLSKRWRHVWAHIRYLNFFPRETLDADSVVEEEPMYCSWVDQVVSLHKAPTIDEFEIQYHLGVGRKENIDKWIRFALEKRAKRLELDVAPWTIDNSISYTFPNLPFCNSLTDLDLYYVRVSGEVLERIPSDCPTLEYLSVTSSDSLIDFVVAGPSLNLKSLRIIYCFEIKHLEISAPNLKFFHYVGPTLSPPFKSTPKIEMLTIEPILETKSIAEVFPIRTTLKTLVMSIEPSSDVQLFRLRFLLKACPFLHKFALEFCFIDDEVEQTEMTKDVKACPDYRLKILEIDEFVGWEVDTAFVRYLIESAVSLKEMIIKPTVMTTDWEPSVDERRTRAIRQAEILQLNLKPCTLFQIRD